MFFRVVCGKEVHTTLSNKYVMFGFLFSRVVDAPPLGSHKKFGSCVFTVITALQWVGVMHTTHSDLVMNENNYQDDFFFLNETLVLGIKHMSTCIKITTKIVRSF